MTGDARSQPSIEALLAENNRLLTEQNRLLERAIGASNAAAAQQSMQEIRERARRNTPWWGEYPSWAK